VKVRVVIEYDPEVSAYAAYCPELPGCTICGDTERQALQRFKQALRHYFEPAPVRIQFE
jgi:predicted RNase H-like HicB family nuclease